MRRYNIKDNWIDLEARIFAKKLVLHRAIVMLLVMGRGACVPISYSAALVPCPLSP